MHFLVEPWGLKIGSSLKMYALDRSQSRWNKAGHFERDLQSISLILFEVISSFDVTVKILNVLGFWPLASSSFFRSSASSAKLLFSPKASLDLIQFLISLLHHYLDWIIFVFHFSGFFPEGVLHALQIFKCNRSAQSRFRSRVSDLHGVAHVRPLSFFVSSCLIH